MSILASDLEYRYSNPQASGGSQLAQKDPSGSLGGFLSRSVWAGGVLHDLFGKVSGPANLARAVEYRCLFVVNKHATLTWTAPVLWISAEQAGGAQTAVGVDPTACSALDAPNGQAVTSDDPTYAPAGVVFATPTDKTHGLALGDIPPGQCRAFWVRRAALGSSAMADDNATFRVEGDTL